MMVLSTIPKGRVVSIDSAPIKGMPGVLAVMTHQNAPCLPKPQDADKDGKGGSEQRSKPDQKQTPPNPKLSLLQDDRVLYNAQPVAVVVADTFEHARDAAQRLRVHYASEPAQLDFQKAKQNLRRPQPRPERPPDTGRGNVARSMENTQAKLDLVFTTPMENHHPLEPHATIAQWEGDRLTLYDAAAPAELCGEGSGKGLAMV
jgi:xanthine dehydrogenase YagR molybdenum-binding subunit